SEQGLHACPVAYVKITVSESAGLGLELVKVPSRVTKIAEEFAAHVVVDADYVMAHPVVMTNRLGSNQSAAAGDKKLQFGSPGSELIRQLGQHDSIAVSDR